ncbi:GGDEF domain-containing protein [Herbaspirillum rhizosphaerae]|uniref:GGDEF domain-containing protein n=1 Tax=Herbaspirillum rhizosphaerae TaxID=346179 RepID=UPI00142F3918|nr:GGDEF domain-containing protein [Herbaspirillum rhizosphaerae]
MLSQRIALLSTDLYVGDLSTSEAMQDAVTQIERAQDILTGKGDPAGSQLSAAEHELYFVGSNPIDTEVRSFLEDTRRFIGATNMNAGNEAYRALQHHARDLLLPALDRAATLFAEQADVRTEQARKAQLLVLVAFFIALALEAVLIFRPMITKIRRYNAHLYEMATRDPLTGLANQRHFDEYANREFRLARRTAKPLSMAVCDIDNFEQINDTHGRAVGDAVLRRFGELAARILRDTDIISRVGGEEFALALPVMNLHGAMIIAEKLRRGMAENKSDNLPPFTISVGVAVSEHGDKKMEDLLQRADSALQMAKSEGRNRISCLNRPLREQQQDNGAVSQNTDTATS